jgi:hypothetical protein
MTQPGALAGIKGEEKEQIEGLGAERNWKIEPWRTTFLQTGRRRHAWSAMINRWLHGVS